jgi:transcription antitermination factor NusG
MPTGPVNSIAHELSGYYDVPEAPGNVALGHSDGGGLCHLTQDHVAEPHDVKPDQWFALVVKPRFDKAVGRTLEAKGFETLVPTYRKSHTYGTRTKFSELPLFPGYVCCRFDIRRSLPVLSTPGVVHVVGARSVPIAISDVEIQSLQTAIRAHVPVEPFPFVSVGQRVRITSGALAGVEGIVLGPKPKLRIVLSIALLQRSVLLEIDRDQVHAEGTLALVPSA